LANFIYSGIEDEKSKILYNFESLIGKDTKSENSKSLSSNQSTSSLIFD
jgi:hypothetical protein